MNNFLAQLLGQGMAKDASNDMQLRQQWLKLRERRDLGELAPEEHPMADDYQLFRRMMLQNG